MIPWLSALVVFYLPGAMLYRIPAFERSSRAELAAEERAFWAVVISTAWSLAVVLLLAMSEAYSFNRLLVINLGLIAAIAVRWRGRLSYGREAAPITWRALLPAGIVLVGVWLYFPASEYILGGKDPGAYLNEGVQIAETGNIVARDPVIESVPPRFWDLFFPSHRRTDYYSVRFMGFFIQDPTIGTVIGQFPHLFPASIALTYQLNGLTGARSAAGAWAILGLLAVYFLASALFGRTAAFAAAILLALNVVEVWFARYPNAELAMQTFLASAILAFLYATAGQRAFFGVVSGVLLGLLLFLRYDTILAIGAFVAAVVLLPVHRAAIGRAFGVALGAAGALGLWYLMVPMRAYSSYPLAFTRSRWWLVALAFAAAGLGRYLLGFERIAGFVRQSVPYALSATMGSLAIYAYFFRRQEGALALGDAMAFQSYGWYLTPWVLGLAVVAAVWLIAKSFWRGPVFYITFAIFSVFFFYKTRIVPEHFWGARRYLAITLPGSMMLIAAFVDDLVGGSRLSGLAARAGGRAPVDPRPSPAFAAFGTLVVATALMPIGLTFWRNAAPVRSHLEYAGLIHELDTLAAAIGRNDLVLVESRNAGSDLHTLAMPLTYVYGKHVLVLDSVVPPKRSIEAFVDWARTKYDHVLFLGGGGTDLLTRRITAEPVSSGHFQVPEYASPLNEYPTTVRRKEFEFSFYRLTPATTAASGPIDLRIGGFDDLNVVRFHAKEREAETGVLFRWTSGQSFVLLSGVEPAAREITIWMGSGGRPADAPVATIEVALDNQAIGSATVNGPVRAFAFRLPPDLAARAAAADDPLWLRLRVPTWNPAAMLGVDDPRDLGVMITRVEVK